MKAFEKHDEAEVDKDGFEVVDETPEFRATVDMEVQAKVDSNHPDARAEEGPDHLFGKTLEQEERIEARKTELEHISVQAELGRQEGRVERTREVVVEQCGRDEPERKDKPNPREKLAQSELAKVNQQAMRISERIDGGWSRAVVAKQLAERVQRG